MKPIRVVQYGSWGYTHSDHTMLTMRSLPDYYEVVGFCEPDEAQRKSAMERRAYQGLKIYSKEEILKDRSIDAVIVETKELEQAADALEFAKAGFHIHSDKPCGASHEVFSELIQEVKKRNLIFQNGYMYRYNPAVTKAYEIVKSGRIGKLICMEAQMSQCYHGEGIRWLKDLPGGMMFYLGCHLVDIIYQFMGEPEDVLSFNIASKLEDQNAKDFGLALLRYPHGISMIKTTACEVSGDARRQIIISGTEGTIEIKPPESPIELEGTVCPNQISMSVTYPGHGMLFADRAEVISFPPFGRYDAMMMDFAKTVAGEKENTFDYDRELAVHRLLTRVCKGA